MTKIYMDWTREKAIELLLLFDHSKEYLESLTDAQLMELGVRRGVWKRR